jgi:hypothetical protein
MILQDNIAHHPKFLLAGQLIGGSAGASRALALWVAAIGYAREGLTDGVVHDAFLSTFALDSDPKKVANALTSRRVRLFHRVKGGYKIHDFTEYNGSADKLRRQRELAKARKRKQRAQQAVENLWKSETRHDVTRDRGRDNPRDSRARDLEKEKEKETVRTAASTVRSGSLPDQVPKREQWPAGHETSRVALSEQKKDDLRRAPAADGNYAVIEKLAHVVLEELDASNPESPHVVETLKVRCAQLGIHYTTHPNITRLALASAATQRTLHPATGPSAAWLADVARRLKQAPTAAALRQQLNALARSRRARR